MLARPLSEPLNFSVEEGFCSRCRLRHTACFCKCWLNISSALNLQIVAHGEELRKDSNTALMLKKSLRHCQLQVWQRKKAIFNTAEDRQPSCARSTLVDTAANEHINPSHQKRPVLLLPAAMANCYRGEQGQAHPMLSTPDLEGRSVLLLDGSWQQVRKIYRQSSELKELDCYELQADKNFDLGGFPLRRNQHEAGFCSAQAIALLLWHLGEGDSAQSLLGSFKRFCHHVLVSRDQRTKL